MQVADHPPGPGVDPHEPEAVRAGGTRVVNGHLPLRLKGTERLRPVKMGHDAPGEEVHREPQLFRLADTHFYGGLPVQAAVVDAVIGKKGEVRHRFMKHPQVAAVNHRAGRVLKFRNGRVIAVKPAAADGLLNFLKQADPAV